MRLAPVFNNLDNGYYTTLLIVAGNSPVEQVRPTLFGELKAQLDNNLNGNLNVSLK
jgi:hypothetical protein